MVPDSMWTEDPRGHIELVFASLSGIFESRSGFRTLDLEAYKRTKFQKSGKWLERVQCQKCGSDINPLYTRNSAKWCSERCRGQVKYAAKKQRKAIGEDLKVAQAMDPKCRMCGAESRTKWCSNRCKQRAKYQRKKLEKP